MDTIFMLVGAVFSFGFGWVLAIDQDRAWKWHETGMRRKGLPVDLLERTSEWEVDMAWRGFVFMGMGVLFFMATLCNA